MFIVSDKTTIAESNRQNQTPTSREGQPFPAGATLSPNEDIRQSFLGEVMQNKSNFPQDKTLSQSPVRTNPSDKAPMQNNNNLADGKQPHQPGESAVN